MISPAQKKTRFNIPDLPRAEDLLPYWKRIDENLWYTNFGPLVTEFETAFCREMEKAHGLPSNKLNVIAVNSGYSGIVVALKLVGVGQGARVLVPAINFPAGPLAVENLGGSCVIADLDPATWTLTPAIARAIAATTKIDAVMPVAVYGVPLPAREWDAFTRDTGIPVVIDAAAAIENQPYLETGLVVHSLHALKPMGAGEGGLVVAADPSLIEQAKLIVNFGMTNHQSVTNGMNAKMSEYHAAIALVQIDRWAAVKARRRAVFDLYRHALAAQPDLPVTLRDDLDLPVVSSLMIQTQRDLPSDILDRMAARDVCAHRTYFPPLYAHKHFASLDVADANGRLFSGTLSLPEKAAALPVTESLSRTVLGLPFHAFLDEADVALTLTALRESLK